MTARRGGRGSNFDYGFACEECGNHVMGKDRSRLAARRWPTTLCSVCLDLAEAEAHRRRREEREQAEAERLRALERELTCVECQAPFRRRVKNGNPPLTCGSACWQARFRRKRGIRGERYSGPPRRGYVYRLRDSTGRLLYIGKTYCVRARLYGGRTSHSQTKSWWADVASVEVAVYPTEAEALDAERWAIQQEMPLHNVARDRPHTETPPPWVHRYVGQVT